MSMKALLQKARLAKQQDSQETKEEPITCSASSSRDALQLPPPLHSLQSAPPPPLATYHLQHLPVARAYYIRDFVSPADDQQIVQLIEQAPLHRWTKLPTSGRQLQQWGGQVTAGGLTEAESLPHYQQQCIQKLMQHGIFTTSQQPNHVLMNQYPPGIGIMPHKDGPVYTSVVAIISLNAPILLQFFRRLPSSSKRSTAYEYAVWCEPGSCIIFTDELYTAWFHGIDSIDYDTIDERVANAEQCGLTMGQRIQRQATRYSLTIRHVPLADDQ